MSLIADIEKALGEAQQALKDRERHVKELEATLASVRHRGLLLENAVRNYAGHVWNDIERLLEDLHE